LKDTLTGDSLGTSSAPIHYPPSNCPSLRLPSPWSPKSRADEDKLSSGLHKLMEEDAMLPVFSRFADNEFLIAGRGSQHIEVAVARLKKRYHAEVI